MEHHDSDEDLEDEESGKEPEYLRDWLSSPDSTDDGNVDSNV